MPKRKSIVSQPHPASAFERAARELNRPPVAYPNVSARWLAKAAAAMAVLALVCAWLTLCLLYWQGSWQLLYHPRSAILRTPASAGLRYEAIRFGAMETGTPQLTGWWIPAGKGGGSRFAVLYCHGADGNLGDSVSALAALHEMGMAVFAFDYRGYGQSQPSRPSESQLRQDAAWALDWLTLTRHVPSREILVYGSGLGANLATEVVAEHAELAGVILDQPIENPMATVFDDARSKLVPAHWLVDDRLDLNSAAHELHKPSLWLFASSGQSGSDSAALARKGVTGNSTVVWLTPPVTADAHFSESVRRWLDEL